MLLLLALIACKDADNDGVYAREDCEDQDWRVYPGKPEVCGDGVVNDCETSEEEALAFCASEQRLEEATAELTNAGEGYQMGHVRPAGDVDGDGFDDLLVQRTQGSGFPYQYSEPWILPGPLEGRPPLVELGWRLVPEPGRLNTGVSTASAGDVDGDGWTDVLVGSPFGEAEGDKGLVYLLQGPIDGERSLADAAAWIELPAACGSFDCALVASAGDVNGDGLGDVLIGDARALTEGRTGRVWLLHGPVSGDVSLSEVDDRITGVSDSDGVGRAFTGPGDVNGDGLDDLLLGGLASDEEGYPTATAWLALGPVSGTRAVSEVEVAFDTGIYGGWPGANVHAPGDVDGDGLADLLISAGGASAVWGGGSEAYLVLGAAQGVASEDLAEAILVTGMTMNLAPAGDVDGDGHPDLIVSGDIDPEVGARLFLGPLEGTLESSDADTRYLLGRQALSSAWLVGVGDPDADGLGDVLIGSALMSGSLRGI